MHPFKGQQSNSLFKKVLNVPLKRMTTATLVLRPSISLPYQPSFPCGCCCWAALQVVLRSSPWTTPVFWAVQFPKSTTSVLFFPQQTPVFPRSHTVLAEFSGLTLTQRLKLSWIKTPNQVRLMKQWCYTWRDKGHETFIPSDFCAITHVLVSGVCDFQLWTTFISHIKDLIVSVTKWG